MLLPEWAKDRLYITTDISLSLKDRLKVLFGWGLQLRTKTDCEHEPGRSETQSQVYVLTPPRFVRQQSGMVEARIDAANDR